MSEISMIRISKFAAGWSLTGTSRLLISRTLLALAIVVAVDIFVASASAQSGSRPSRNRPPRSQPSRKQPVEQAIESTDDIAVAREKAKTAKEKYNTVKKLSRLGSASQKELRFAEVSKWLALLELSDLQSPVSKPQNAVLRAKLILNYRNKELKVINKLHERGAASKLELQRAKTARDVAKSQLKAVEGGSVAQRKIHVINAASSKYQSAEKEHRLAAKLLQSGSISKATMDQAENNLKTAKSELAEAKKSLGAQAVQVQAQ